MLSIIKRRFFQKKPKNRFFTTFVAIFVAIFLILSFDLVYFLKTPLIIAGQKPVNFIFTQGMSVRKAATALKEQNLIKRKSFFILLARIRMSERNLKAGEYSIEPGITTPAGLLAKMEKGIMIRHAFTIVEGWTFAQVIAALNNNQFIKHTIQTLSDSEIMSKIGCFGELPEGRFAPDTYLFSGSIKDIDILIGAYKLMQKRLQAAWDNKAIEAVYHNPYEALIVASLIEKETAFEKEKPLIAGVILSRLENNRLLQIDPSIIYGLNKKHGEKLSKKDYKKDTPYNTYTRKGLPPTPISMPSNGSIYASLHPQASKFLYYVAKGDGTHKFSNTFIEQKKAVKKYLLNK